MWMAPCAKTFKPATAASAGSKFVFHDCVEPKFFTGPDVPDRATVVVVSAQVVSRPFLEAWRGKHPEEQLLLVRRITCHRQSNAGESPGRRHVWNVFAGGATPVAPARGGGARAGGRPAARTQF